MQKHQLYINLLTLTSALAFSACVEEVVYVVNPDVPEVGEKTPIELSIGGVEGEVSASTRAVITNGTGNKNFTAGTSIFMLMKSEYEALTGAYAGYDYGGTDKSSDKYSTTMGKVDTDGSSIVFEDDATITRTRYWNDAHARSSHLSIWAVACDELNSLGGIGTSLGENSSIFNNANARTLWQTTSIKATELQWNVPHVGISVMGFDASSIKDRDLLFSNNVTKYTVNSTDTDNRTKYDTGTKKFGNSALVFRHALSKIVVNIKKGAGFTSADGFSFPSGKNIKLNYFNMWGKFNIEKGEFTVVNNAGGGGDGHAAIDYMYNKSTVENSDHAYELEALVLPYFPSDPKVYDGSQFTKDNVNVMMEFTIDNNTYQLTAGQLYTALHGITNVTEESNQILLDAGKKYVFTFTVGKSVIDNISAKIVDWETIETNITPSNARIKIQLEERGDEVNSDVAIYKSEDNKTTDGVDDNYTVYNWKTGYANMNATYSTDHWTTDIYWRNSKEFYHFRALKPESTGVTTESTVGDYVSLTSGVSYTDVLWGAPMRDDANNETAGTFKWSYDFTNGFSSTNNINLSGKNQIYQAIGATEDKIKLTLFHMMSDLTFNIKTTTGDDQVTLAVGDKKTRVNIIGCSPTGKVLLGNGRVVPGAIDMLDVLTEPVALNSENPSGTHVYKYGIVPQDLTGVKLYITTPDNNQYIVDLKDIKVTFVSDNNIQNPYTSVTENGVTKYKIDKWYPGFKYTYNFTLKKTGISELSATVVGWETVTSDNDEVQIQ